MYELQAVSATELLYPRYEKAVIASEIPDTYKEELNEAAAVLSISPKASAALSRRLLQRILREEYGINKGNLAKEIEAFLGDDIPSYIMEQVDGVRIIGNFATHPNKSHNTGEIVDVEPEEAEWLIETLQDLLDFTFVKPATLAKRKVKVSAKDKSSKKPKASS